MNNMQTLNTPIWGESNIREVFELYSMIESLNKVMLNTRLDYAPMILYLDK